MALTEDPFTHLLRVTLVHLLDPARPEWAETKRALSDLKDESFDAIHASLLAYLLNDYNSRLALKTALFELHKNPAKFPSVFLEQYSTNESIAWFWKRRVHGRGWRFDKVPVPSFQIGQELAEEMDPKLSEFINVEEIVSRPKWKFAGFRLRAKQVLEMMVKYLLSESMNVTNGVGYCLELAMKPINEHSTTGPEENDAGSDPKVLLSQCLLRLSESVGYDVPRRESSADRRDLGVKYYAIPLEENRSEDSVFVSFKRTAEYEGERDAHVVLELSSKEYYSQYSETVVILYNYARIKKILERYEGLVESGEYPVLPSLENVDFNLIGECKEEFPIVLMMFLWPRVQNSIINLHRKGKGYDKVNLPFLFDFVKSLARSFDSFYTRNIVIVPRSAPHNFPIMFARLYFIQAVNKIFKEFIHLSGIEMD